MKKGIRNLKSLSFLNAAMEMQSNTIPMLKRPFYQVSLSSLAIESSTSNIQKNVVDFVDVDSELEIINNKYYYYYY